MPRDREASFEPMLVKKRQTRLEGFEEKILALYAHGMTTRDIQAQLQGLYGVEVSPTFISNVTEEVMDARTRVRRIARESHWTPSCTWIVSWVMRA